MKQAILLLAVAAVLFALPTISVAETISAYFEGDPTDPAAVDTYPGVAGEGWAAGWLKRTDKLTSNTVAVANTSPLASGTGKYLTCFMDASAADGLLTVGRSYGGKDLGGNPVIDLSQDHTISCLFRVDENLGEGTTFYTSSVDRYELYGSIGTGLDKGVGASSTWIIGAYGATSTAGDGHTISAGNWVFKDYISGSSYTYDTGIALATGATYSLDVTLHNSTYTWDATITEVANPTSTYTKMGMGYRSLGASAPIPQFFGKASGSNDNRQFSIDSVVVHQVPEPSMIILTLGAALAGLTVGRRRK